MFEGIFTVTSSLFIVGLVLYFAYIFSRYIGGMGRVRGMSGHIKVVDQVFMGQDKAIAIIEVGGKFMLVGITAGQISLLKEIEQSELGEIQENSSSTEILSFKAIIEKLGKKDINQ